MSAHPPVAQPPPIGGQRPARAAPPPPPPDDEEDEDSGAQANEILLAAAKHDNEEMYEEAISKPHDINHTDGLGNTPLHYAVLNASISVLNHILEHESCDVDPQNRTDRDTPLHIAVRQHWEDHEGLKLYLVSQLLEAGANANIRNRYNQKPIDILPQSYSAAYEEDEEEDEDEQVREAIRQAGAQKVFAAEGDVVREEDVIDPNDIASDSD